MNNNDQFLILYKTYEGLLREHGKEYREVEETSDDLTTNRMRIMRQLRNYLSHTADVGFIQISDLQIKLLEELITKERLTGDIVANHLQTIKRSSCEENTPVRDVLMKMVRQQILYLPVLAEGKLQGAVSVFKLTKLFAENPESLLNAKTYGKYEKKSILCVTPEEEMDVVLKQKENYPLICCTKDGTWNGKFLGLCKMEKLD